MPKKDDQVTKIQILKNIETILNAEPNLDAKLVFARIQHYLEPKEHEGFTSGEIGFVHIDESRQDEYLKWEEDIKQEWLAIIEDIRKSISKGQGMIEYVVVFVAVITAIIISAKLMASRVRGAYSGIQGQVSDAASLGEE